MIQRRDRRADSPAQPLRPRRLLRVERLERRSMLAADVGDPQRVADLVEAASAVEIDPLLAVEACVLIDPGFICDARITTDPPDVWVPIAFDPGTCVVDVDPQGPDLGTEGVSAGDFAGADTGAPDPSNDGEITSGSDDAGSTEATESSLPEGASLVVCPAWIDLPVLDVVEPMPVVDPILIVDPVLVVDPIAVDPAAVGDSVEATSADVGVGDATDVGITDEVVIEPWFRVYLHDGPPILCYCGGGLASAVVADDVIVSSGVTAESSADERRSMEVAAAPAPENASSAPAAPTVPAGTSDAARLFAAYASGLGQSGADAQAAVGIGGRRSGRRAL